MPQHEPEAEAPATKQQGNRQGVEATGGGKEPMHGWSGRPVLLQGISDGLVERHGPPLGPGRRPRRLVQLGAGGSLVALNLGTRAGVWGDADRRP